MEPGRKGGGRKGEKRESWASRPFNTLPKKCHESAQAGPQFVEFHAGKQALNNSEKARVCVRFFISEPILEKQGWYCVAAAVRRSGDRWVISAQKCFDSPSESETPQTAVWSFQLHFPRRSGLILICYMKSFARTHTLMFKHPAATHAPIIPSYPRTAERSSSPLLQKVARLPPPSPPPRRYSTAAFYCSAHLAGPGCTATHPRDFSKRVIMAALRPQSLAVGWG